MSTESFLITNFLFIFAALLPIINPLGLMTFFVTMTANNSEPEKYFLARRATLYCFLLLLGSIYVGGYVLSFFGVSLPVIQLAGGILIAMTAWRILNDDAIERPVVMADLAPSEHKELLKQRAFYPLTFPLTVGPGAISVAITLGATLSGKTIVEKFTLLPLAGVSAVAPLSAITWVCLRYADKLLRIFSKTASVVILRLTAFILLCLGIQIIWTAFIRLLEPLL